MIMNFKQLATAAFTQDAIRDFNIVASDHRLALLGSTGDIFVLELRNTHLLYDSFPYSIARLAIPSDRPCSKIINEFELCSIYSKCDVQESQELALDPVYVGDCTLEALKIQIQDIIWAPQYDNRPTKDPLVAILSLYGACSLQVKNKVRRDWNTVVCNINNIYLMQVFPLKNMRLNYVNNFQGFKSAVDMHWITAITWHPQKPILFTANAMGWIVGFQLNEPHDLSIKLKYSSEMGRICYIRAFDDFLLIANVMGVVALYTIKPVCSKGDVGKNSFGDSTMEKVECLWSKTDRMSCRKAEMTLCKDNSGYILVFCKSAHVLAYRLSGNGNILGRCTLYVGGGKITGMESLSDSEFVVTTVTGIVKYIHVDYNETNGLQISEQIIKTDFDTNNYQLLGVTATPHKQIWTFMLFRCKDYTHHSKYSQSSAIVSVCNLSTIEPLREFINLNKRTFDTLLDYVVAVRLEIFNNIRHKEAKNFFDLETAKFPIKLNDAFLQKLQLKLMVTKFQVAFQAEIFKNVKAVTQIELDFLNSSVQTTHIICTLRQLNIIICEKTPTSFQLLAGSCLRRKFHVLLRDLQAQISEENSLKDTIDRYLKLVMECFKKIPTNYEHEEQCLLCQELIDDTTMLCAAAHKIRRCCITFVQLPFFNSRYCAQCNEAALDDDNQLREVIGPNEIPKCTFCRFALVNSTLESSN